MGDGSVSLILDIAGIARRANLLNKQKANDGFAASGAEHGRGEKAEEQESGRQESRGEEK